MFKSRECVEANASICMYANGNKIEKSEYADHLGHRISTNDKESMCKSAIASFWMYFNMFMCDVDHTYSFVKHKLFKMHCYSFYSTPLWCLYGPAIRDLCRPKSLRKVWNVPPQTHNKTISLCQIQCL